MLFDDLITQASSYDVFRLACMFGLEPRGIGEFRISLGYVALVFGCFIVISSSKNYTTLRKWGPDSFFYWTTRSVSKLWSHRKKNHRIWTSYEEVMLIFVLGKIVDLWCVRKCELFHRICDALFANANFLSQMRLLPALLCSQFANATSEVC